MQEIKPPVFEYLGVDGDHHLFKIYFPVVEKIAGGKFSFILDDGNNDKSIGSYGVIVRLRPEDLLFYGLDAQYVQIEIKNRNNTIKDEDLNDSLIDVDEKLSLNRRRISL